MTLGSTLSVKVQLVASPLGVGSRVSSPRINYKDEEGGDIGTKPSPESVRNGREEGEGVRGVRMMLEVQGPGGRYRLGEVIHGEETTPASTPNGPEGGPAGSEDKEAAKVEEESESSQVEQAVSPVQPILRPGEFVELDVDAEMKELGLQVLICSVAWETDTGRRTFQRFFKFNVSTLTFLRFPSCCSRVRTIPASVDAEFD